MNVNLYKILGQRFYIYASISMIVLFLSLLPVNIGILTLGLDLVLFVFQILIIVGAKKASKSYNQPALNNFGSIMIGAIIASFASSGMIVAQSFYAAFAAIRTGASTINISPIVLSGLVISMISTILEFVAWIVMISFFKGLGDIKGKKTGIAASVLVVIAMIISIVRIIIIGIPLAMMESTLNVSTDTIIINGSYSLYLLYSLEGEIIAAFCTILAVIAYFMIGASMQSLNFFEAGSKISNQPISGIPPALDFRREMAADMTSSEIPGSPPTPGNQKQSIEKCKYCGMILPLDPNTAFCPSCGARL